MITFAMWRIARFLNIRNKWLLLLPIFNIIYICYVLGDALVILHEWKQSVSAEVAALSLSVILCGMCVFPLNHYVSRLLCMYGAVVLLNTVLYTYLTLKSCFKYYLWLLPAPFALLAISCMLGGKVREALCD